MTEIVVPVRGPLDVAATLERHRRFGDDPTNVFAANGLLRATWVDGAIVPYEVRWSGSVDGAELVVRVPGRRSRRVTDAAVEDVRHVFGLGFDLESFYAMAERDRVLAPLVRRFHGFRPTLASNALETLVGAIVAQQVNLTFAFRLRERLVRRYGDVGRIGRREVRAFPRAETLAAASTGDIRAMQYSERKAEYVIGVATAIASRALQVDALANADDATVITQLTSIRGLGRWSADWFLARHLGRGVVCPAGDLSVRKAFVGFCGMPATASEDAIRRRASEWGEHQNLAIHYLLAALQHPNRLHDRSVRPAKQRGT